MERRSLVGTGSSCGSPLPGPRQKTPRSGGHMLSLNYLTGIDLVDWSEEPLGVEKLSLILMHLLHHRIRKAHPRAFIRTYNSWTSIESMDTNASLRVLDPFYPRNEITFILLDDAQDTYDDGRLWAGFLKDFYAKIGTYRVILFCSYGNSNSHASTKGNPPILRDSACFSLHPMMTKLGLLLDEDELRDVAWRFDPVCRKFNRNLLNCLMRWTGGHAGALCDLLEIICEKKSIIWRQSSDFTDEDFIRELPLDDLIMRISAGGDVARGLPHQHSPNYFSTYWPMAVSNVTPPIFIRVSLRNAIIGAGFLKRYLTITLTTSFHPHSMLAVFLSKSSLLTRYHNLHPFSTFASPSFGTSSVRNSTNQFGLLDLLRH